MTLSPTVTNKKSIKHFSTLESLFNKVHDFNYTYDNFVFTSNSSKGFITCRVHGDFLQKATAHTAGRGCNLCKNEATRARNLDFHNLYRHSTIFYVIMYKGVYKIGVTSRDVYTRYRYEVDSLDDITIVHQLTFPTYKEAEDFEQSLKLRYYRYRYRGLVYLSSQRTLKYS